MGCEPVVSQRRVASSTTAVRMASGCNLTLKEDYWTTGRTRNRESEVRELGSVQDCACIFMSLACARIDEAWYLATTSDFACLITVVSHAFSLNLAAKHARTLARLTFYLHYVEHGYRETV